MSLAKLKIKKNSWGTRCSSQREAHRWPGLAVPPVYQHVAASPEIHHVAQPDLCVDDPCLVQILAIAGGEGTRGVHPVIDKTLQSRHFLAVLGLQTY